MDSCHGMSHESQHGLYSWIQAVFTFLLGNIIDKMFFQMNDLEPALMKYTIIPFQAVVFNLLMTNYSVINSRKHALSIKNICH